MPAERSSTWGGGEDTEIREDKALRSGKREAKGALREENSFPWNFLLENEGGKKKKKMLLELLLTSVPIPGLKLSLLFK